MREQWREAFGEMAREYWTDERTRELTGGKDLLVLPGEAPALLRALGLLHRDATMPPPQVSKYLQLNHMLWLMGPPLRELMERFGVLNFIDAGCGRSYLTTALAWCFRNVWEQPARILGVDINAKLVDECRRRTEITGLQDILRYEAADLDVFDSASAWKSAFGDGVDKTHAVISLHACDTATDDAIALGIAEEAELIAVAPCCQAELARGWKELDEADVDGAFRPIWQTPQLRRTSGAQITDTFRMLLLRAAGYETRVVEFVPSEHTPKNTLIRAMRRSDGDPEALEEYRELRRATGGVGIKLERLLEV
ncbi:class I SAM-dependent methyltransferase [Persicimonas caeni]|nr:SAM-dependent methyltransferase [Persicimonas caeni]